MSHLALTSGVPSSVGGVLVGATDFREFTVSPGLPVGITEYGIGTNSPTAVGISDIPLTPSFTDEGNYFFMTGQGDGSASRWGFGIDSFDGIMEFGELLCRIYYNTLSVKNRNNVGACMSLRGFNGQQGGGADIRWAGGTVFDASVSPPHSAGVISIPAGTATAGFADIQEAEQDPEWMWLRIRRTANIGQPIEDDWQFTGWYGDITDEPASVDGTVIISSLAGPRGLFALGWCAQSFFSLGDQRIAFLSYTDNPLIEPPPLPSDIQDAVVVVPVDTTIWTERVDPDAAVPCDPPKPVISAIELELVSDSFTALNDKQSTTAWIDDSGQGNDASPAGTPIWEEEVWGGSDKPGIKMVEFKADAFSYDATQYANEGEYTVFIVARILDLSLNLDLIGHSTSSSPGARRMTIAIDASGAIRYGHFLNDFWDIITASDLVENGDRILITASFSSITGLVIRLNGVEVGSNVAVGTLIDMADGRVGKGLDQTTGGLGLIRGDKVIAWYSGYTSKVSENQRNAMEGYLGALFDIETGSPSGPKPTIEDPVIEVSVLDGPAPTGEGVTVVLWNDLAETAQLYGDPIPRNNDLRNIPDEGTPSYEPRGWLGDATSAVRFGTNDNYFFDGSAFANTDLTIFAVVRVLDFSTFISVLGGDSNVQLQIELTPSGSIIFGFDTNGGLPLIQSVGGLIEADQACHIITCRHSSTEGKIIRLDGIQVADNPLSTADLASWSSPFIGRTFGFFGTDWRMKWLSGHTKALTLDEMQEMERYLACVYCPEIVVDQEVIWTERVAP